MPFSIFVRTSIVTQNSGFNSSGQPNYALHTSVHDFATEAAAVDANQRINTKAISNFDPRIRSESILLFTKSPVLSNATAAPIGSGNASGTVSTTGTDGTLYRLASTNAKETADTIIAAALSQAVAATGTQNVTFSGLTPGLTYYAHYIHVSGYNTGALPSNSIDSSSFVAT